VTFSELQNNKISTACLLSGNLCSISCPRFSAAILSLSTSKIAQSVDCIYKKVRQEGLTLGQLYFLNKTFISKQTEDRDFLYRVVVGKPLIEDFDEIIYSPLDTVFAQYAPEVVTRKTTVVQDSSGVPSASLLRSLYIETLNIIKRVHEKSLEKSRDILSEAVSNSKAPEHVKHILSTLNEGITSPKYFSMHEYISIIVGFIKNDPKNKFKQYEVLVILKYLVLCFMSKDANDFPSGKINDTQIQKLILSTVSLPDNHPYKWDNKRKQLVQEQDSVYRRIVYTDDFLYLWKLYVVNTPIKELTEQDIRIKYILDTLLQKLCFEYSTERIIIHHMPDVCIKRFKKIIQELFKLIQEPEYRKYFTVYNPTDLLLENQINNQYIITTPEPKHKIEARAKKEKFRRASPQEVYEYLTTHDMLLKTSIHEQGV